MRIASRVGALVAQLLLAASPALAEIKIGSVLSITGPASFLGDPEEKTLRLYVDRINSGGGVNGQELALTIYDDGGDANKARTFATRLVEDDGVVAVLGGSTTGTSLAMIPVFEEAKIPFISLAGGIEIIEPVRPYTFKTPHTDRMACQKIFEDLQARGLTKIALIWGTGGFGRSMHDQCLKVASGYGTSVVADEAYGPRDSDMTPQLTNIKNTSGVQAIIDADFGQGPAIVTRNRQQLGITLPLYQSHGVASKSFIDLAGSAAEGVRLPSAALLVAEKLPDGDPQKPVVMTYKTAYETATGQPVSTFGGHAYDALLLLVDAMQRARGSDPASVRDELERTKGFIGTAGKVSMSPSDHMGLDLTAFRMLEIRNGDWQLLAGS